MTALEQAAAIAAAARRYVRALAAADGTVGTASRLAALFEEADALHALAVALAEPCPLCLAEDCPYADGETDLGAALVPDPGGLLNQS